MASIRDEITDIIRVSSKPRVPDLSDEDKSLFEVGLDSLDYATAIMAIEEKYNLAIAETEIEGLISLNQIVSFVERRVSKA